MKEKTRPWKSIIALILAIVSASVSGWAHHDFRYFFEKGASVPYQIIAAGSAVAFCIFGASATYGLSGQARNVLERRAGPAHAAVVRYAILLIGAFTTLVVTLVLFNVPVGQLVLGGALTTVFVGIAAQQALGNVFAGMVLLLARPFRVGDNIRLRAGALGGQLDGTVTDIGITYVRLDTGGSVMSVPNSQVLNAIVGPVPQAASETASPAAVPALPGKEDTPASPDSHTTASPGSHGAASPGRVDGGSPGADGGPPAADGGPPGADGAASPEKADGTARPEKADGTEREAAPSSQTSLANPAPPEHPPV